MTETEPTLAPVRQHMVVEELLRRLPAVDDATPAEALAFYEELASALATALDEQPLEHSSGA